MWEKTTKEHLDFLRLNCVFSHTNEDMDAIVTGLDLITEDTVLAICGSGDQAFAILEKAKNVVAVDKSVYMLEYAKTRAKALSEGDYAEFLSLSVGNYNRRGVNELEYLRVVKYFQQDGRLDRIKSRLTRLSFKEGDILGILKQNPNHFTKLYLSNAIEWDERRLEKIGAAAIVQILRENMLPDALIYVSDSAASRALDQLKLEAGLTNLAKQAEEKKKCCEMPSQSSHKWNPAVYRITR